ncbi:MAG: hypothetical protein ACXWHF_01465 [Chthoniobacterales bacterium]
MSFRFVNRPTNATRSPAFDTLARIPRTDLYFISGTSMAVYSVKIICGTRDAIGSTR